MTYLLGRRRAVARTTLLVHITSVTVLLILMAGTEGPAAHGTGTGVTLAKFQLFLLAVAALIQIFMIGRWTQYALLARRARARADEPVPPVRGAILALMTMTTAAAWLAEIGCLPMAVYQISNGGRGDPDTDFTIGMIVLFAGITVAAATTTGYVRRGALSRTRARADKEATAERRVRLFAGLSTAIALAFFGAAAVGRLGATAGFTAIGLFFASLCWAARWQKILNSARQSAEADLVRHRARAR